MICWSSAAGKSAIDLYDWVFDFALDAMRGIEAGVSLIEFTFASIAS